MKKEVIRHLKGDIKNFKKEASEDKALIKKLKHKKHEAKESKKHEKSASKKKHHSKKKVAKHTKAGHKKGHAKFEKVMKEFKSGKLHSGSKKGPKVKSPKQAIAIAFSEDRRAAGTAKHGK